MEMERINENTIRVLIGNDDLAERGITFLDLLGNHKQIESFFYSILEEVDVDEQFQETDSVTFQVLPNRDGLELFISKNTPMADGDDIDGQFEGYQEGFADYLKQHMFEQGKDVKSNVDDVDDIEEYLSAPDAMTLEVVFKLNDFEEFIALAKNIRLANVVTDLYTLNGEYYLVVTFLTDESTDGQIANDIALLYEYGDKTHITLDMLEEYGRLLMERSALELSRYYFR
ncbi:adaptor protein MecA [Vagococcus acidifermentans]|uniref:Adapter protein MecA n=1 Tax=Vagococcus acidifermentans TaxID=564710 RepID=A0A430AWU2_9ENTE|nr:adaptor protein MecA [Vagococcus acidifermentans]RSU12537.1 adaptor protein MecA [Vagococcus acidifermentans]